MAKNGEDGLDQVGRFIAWIMGSLLILALAAWVGIGAYGLTIDIRYKTAMTTYLQLYIREYDAINFLNGLPTREIQEK